MYIKSIKGNGKMNSYKENSCGYAYKVQFFCYHNTNLKAMVVYFGTVTQENKKFCVRPPYPLDCNKHKKIQLIGHKAPQSLKIWEEQNNLCASVDWLPAGTTRVPLHVACFRKTTPAPTPSPPLPQWSDCSCNIDPKNRDWRVQASCPEGLKWIQKKKWEWCGWPRCVKGWCQ
mmetsp:Transcript_99954/g.198295  ORF Transcript_99954/g.198295 Transcript_99954/m.198295 type:complete len:173 (-) Transcript_99954:78-596(-)